MVYCADCGARMGYVSPESVHRENGKTFDCDSAFQCGNYRGGHNVNKKKICSSHYVQAAALEKLIEKSIMAVSKCVLDDEEAFVGELKKQWEAKHSKNSEEDKKAMVAARKRVAELDELISNLYVDQVKKSSLKDSLKSS